MSEAGTRQGGAHRRAPSKRPVCHRGGGPGRLCPRGRWAALSRPPVAPWLDPGSYRRAPRGDLPAPSKPPATDSKLAGWPAGQPPGSLAIRLVWLPRRLVVRLSGCKACLAATRCHSLTDKSKIFEGAQMPWRLCQQAISNAHVEQQRHRQQKWEAWQWPRALCQFGYVQGSELPSGGSEHRCGWPRCRRASGVCRPPGPLAARAFRGHGTPAAGTDIGHAPCTYHTDGSAHRTPHTARQL